MAPEREMRAGEDAGTGQHAAVQQCLRRRDDRGPQVRAGDQQCPGRADERGRDVAGQQGGRQLDPQPRGERVHVLCDHEAVQQLRRRRVDRPAEGFGHPQLRPAVGALQVFEVRNDAVAQRAREHG